MPLENGAFSTLRLQIEDFGLFFFAMYRLSMVFLFGFSESSGYLVVFLLLLLLLSKPGPLTIRTGSRPIVDEFSFPTRKTKPRRPAVGPKKKRKKATKKRKEKMRETDTAAQRGERRRRTLTVAGSGSPRFFVVVRVLLWFFCRFFFLLLCRSQWGPPPSSHCPSVTPVFVAAMERANRRRFIPAPSDVFIRRSSAVFSVVVCFFVSFFFCHLCVCVSRSVGWGIPLSPWWW